ncbi:GAF domain-containing protein [Hymenobacter sp. BT188]|uniref:GAF domain-containing protein n=1 Tax=Hymenobacter sp. BT188 TaxID=2763504 RepID=UPI0016518A2F|nr:GAF domain-containing protein [Hymenobacter sp. BT188]MBC6608759.1 GAF domain-containing protein [Hymenobacter sp. BT188]
MIPPALPPNEAARLHSLAEHQLLDTLPEAVYQQITRLAAELCGTPRAALNLVAADRQWAKATAGMAAGSQPRDHSFCAHTILQPTQPLLVADARYDERFYDNPNTRQDPRLIFYAGVPVRDAEGRALGALCVLDSRPRVLSEAKLDALTLLANLVSTHFQVRRTHLALADCQGKLAAALPIVEDLVSAVGSLPAAEGAGLLSPLRQVQHLLQPLS